jgi:hypothetical protein
MVRRLVQVHEERCSYSILRPTHRRMPVFGCRYTLQKRHTRLDDAVAWVHSEARDRWHVAGSTSIHNVRLDHALPSRVQWCRV